MSDEKMLAEFEAWVRKVRPGFVIDRAVLMGFYKGDDGACIDDMCFAWQASRTAQSDAEPVYQIRSSINLWIDVTPQRYEDLKGTPENSRILYATPAPVKPAESNEDAQLDKMTTLRFRRLCNAIGYPDPSDGAETMSVGLLFSSFGAMASMLERISPIGAGDEESKS